MQMVKSSPIILYICLLFIYYLSVNNIIQKYAVHNSLHIYYLFSQNYDVTVLRGWGNNTNEKDVEGRKLHFHFL